MVKQKKFKKLNKHSFYHILGFLDEEYDKTSDKLLKKDINQIRMLMLLANLKFTTDDVINTPTFLLLENSNINKTIKDYIDEHLKKGFCNKDEILFTNHENKPLKKEDIDPLLNKTKIPGFNRKIIFSKLNHISTRYNKHLSKNLNKKIYDENQKKYRELLRNYRDKQKAEKELPAIDDGSDDIEVLDDNLEFENSDADQLSITYNDLDVIKNNLRDISDFINKFRNEDLKYITKYTDSNYDPINALEVASWINPSSYSDCFDELNDKASENSDLIYKIIKKMNNINQNIDYIQDVAKNNNSEDIIKSINTNADSLNVLKSKISRNSGLVNQSINKINDVNQNLKNLRLLYSHTLSLKLDDVNEKLKDLSSYSDRGEYSLNILKNNASKNSELINEIIDLINNTNKNIDRRYNSICDNQNKDIILVKDSFNNLTKKLENINYNKDHIKNIDNINENIKYIHDDIDKINNILISREFFEKYYININEKIDRIINYLTNTTFKQNKNPTYKSDENSNTRSNNKQATPPKDHISSKPIITDHKISTPKNPRKFTLDEFLYNWIRKNITITNNVHNHIDSYKIKQKVKKYSNDHNIQVDGKITTPRIKNAVERYYKSHNKKLKNKHEFFIKKNIKGTYSFSNLKFEENAQIQRDNNFKNIMIKWIQNNIKQTRNQKDSVKTEEIAKILKPLFRRQGWIFVDKKDLDKFKDLEIPKICPNYAFSRVIGKAMKVVYKSVEKNKEVIRNRTYYKGIEIIPNKTDAEVNNLIEESINPLDKFNSPVYNWLEDNLIYTEDDNNNLITPDDLFNKFKEDITDHMQIPDDILKTVFMNDLNMFYNESTGKTINDKYIQNFKYKNTIQGHEHINNWINIYLEKTSKKEDTLKFDVIDEKISSYCLKHGLSKVNDELYTLLGDDIKNRAIPESKFKMMIKTQLKKQYPEITKFNKTIYTNIKLADIKIITEDVINYWVYENINIIDDLNHIEGHMSIMDVLIKYLNTNNFKNIYKIDVNTQLENSISNYYLENKNDEIRTLKDSTNKYYRSISLK